jgi:hypothetical protein
LGVGGGGQSLIKEKEKEKEKETLQIRKRFWSFYECIIMNKYQIIVKFEELL